LCFESQTDGSIKSSLLEQENYFTETENGTESWKEPLKRNRNLPNREDTGSS